jgi:hypothetical protein
MALVVAFDHGRARAKKIGPIENPRRHLGVYLIGENLNVLGPHGAGPVECCKTIFAAQNNNIDSEMNAGAQHRFQIPKTVRVSLRSSLAQRRPHFRNRAAKKRL